VSEQASTDARPASGGARQLSKFLLGGNGALGVPIVAAVVLLLFPSIGGSAYWVDQLELIAIYTLVVSGLNLSFGFAGEVQFGQVLMFAIGAYLAGALATHWSTNVFWLMLIAGVAAALVATVIALPALRIGGWSLAMTSFFLVITIPELTQILHKYTGGEAGLSIPIPTFFGTTLGPNGLYRLTIAVAVVWMIVYRNLVTSRYGIIFRLLRESPVLASSLGFSTMRLKVLAYGLGALPAGIAGVFFAFQIEYVTPSTFGLALAIGFVAASVLGGTESIYGAIIGSAIFQLGPNASLSFQQYAPVAYGVFLIVAAIAFPRGLSGLGKALARIASRRLVPAEPVVAAPPGRYDIPAPEELPHDELPGYEPPPLKERVGSRLAVSHVSKAFGGVKASNDVSLSAEPGKVTALIGSNGSGKTTLLNLISGYTKVDGGEITLGEQTITGMAPHKIARLGVGRTFQTPSVPRGLSALEVVAAGRYCEENVGVLGSMLRLPNYWRARRSDRREALMALEEVGLAHLAGEEAATLSLGTRRLLEVARAICGRAELILLDEPASGLSEGEVEVLGNVIRAAADAGTTVVLIEHNFHFIVGISDAVHVLHAGALIASGDAKSIGHDPGVIESYLGSQTARSLSSPSSPPLIDRPATAS
jgi:branched-chain amino acid transport system permease protein